MGAGPSCLECRWFFLKRPWWKRLLGIQPSYAELNTVVCRLTGTLIMDERQTLNRTGMCGPLGKLFVRKHRVKV